MTNKAPSSEYQVPLHRQIAEIISEQVSSGQLRPGEKLPSERQIAQRFQASRATVRTALAHLEQDGLISRRQRRSAVVSIRRDVTPSLRIACTHPRLLRVFERMAEMHLLPARSQVFFWSPTYSQGGQLAARAATEADLLICPLDYARCFTGRKEYVINPPDNLTGEISINETLIKICRHDGEMTVMPLSFSPLVLYANRHIFSRRQVDWPAGNLPLSFIPQSARRLTGEDGFGLQIQPVFSHLTAWWNMFGVNLYTPEGRLSVGQPGFSDALQTLHRLLHEDRAIALLPRLEMLNLFAQGRCAMTLDGQESYDSYSQSLGDALALAPLPGSHGVLQGCVAVMLGGKDHPQGPLMDALRNILGPGTQRSMMRCGGGLPVREDLLNIESLTSLGLTEPHARLFLQELHRAEVSNLPRDAAYHSKLDELFMEFWLGLDRLENIQRRLREIA